MEMTLKAVLASSLLALGLLTAAPATAQRLEVGPDGPAVVVRPRGREVIERGDVRPGVERREIRRERREIRRPELDDDDDED